MSRPARPSYKTRNWPTCNEVLKRRGSLTIWFDPGMNWVAAPTGERSRQQAGSDAAVQTCLSVKVLSGMALRQMTGFVESLLRLMGLNRAVPDFSTRSRRRQRLAVTIPYRGSKGPLHLLIDSAGIKVEGEGEWNARRHGGPKRRVWRKIHLGIDERVLEVRAVGITGSHIGDAPVLPDLPDRIPEDQEIGSVTSDGAGDTRKCHDAIARRGADAVIPPRRKAPPWRTVTAGAIACNEALRSSKYPGRALWRRWSRYHRQSRVETRIHCVKLPGQRLTARDFDRQVAELLVRIAVMNGCTALGMPITEPGNRSVRGSGNLGNQPIYATEPRAGRQCLPESRELADGL